MEIENLLNTQSPTAAAEDGRPRRRSKSPAEKSTGSHEMSAVATTSQHGQYQPTNFPSPYQNHLSQYPQYPHDAHQHPEYPHYHSQIASADASQLREPQHHSYGSRSEMNAHNSQPEAHSTEPAAQGLESYNSHDASRDRPLACSSCGKGFARRSDLVRHERIHSNDRPHSCSTCGKQFIQRSALTVHERVHTGLKPHVCEKCNKPFSDSSSLARHRRIHTGKRPYQCNFAGCGKTFTRRTTLTRHQNSHPPDPENPASRTAAAALNAQSDTPDSVPTRPAEGDRQLPWASASNSQSPGSRTHNSTSTQAWSNAGSMSEQGGQNYGQPVEHAYPPSQPMQPASGNQRSLRSGRRTYPEAPIPASEQSQGHVQHDASIAGPASGAKTSNYASYDNHSLQYHTAYEPNYMHGQSTPYFHQPNHAPY